jgi:hypothetical protein
MFHKHGGASRGLASGACEVRVARLTGRWKLVTLVLIVAEWSGRVAAVGVGYSQSGSRRSKYACMYVLRVCMS